MAALLMMASAFVRTALPVLFFGGVGSLVAILFAAQGRRRCGILHRFCRRPC